MTTRINEPRIGLWGYWRDDDLKRHDTHRIRVPTVMPYPVTARR